VPVRLLAILLLRWPHSGLQTLHVTSFDTVAPSMLVEHAVINQMVGLSICYFEFRAKDASTTQSKLGFKICGMQVFRCL
jgi:hypothetical protein